MSLASFASPAEATPTKAEMRAEAARYQARFMAAGAQNVEADVMLPADLLLDLYGEDIRARAFTTHDPFYGEAVLRPDFTVPVVQMHMETGASPARYTYAGEVFRRQQDGAGRAREIFQAGYELFDHSDPAAADAEVFALFADVLADLNLRAATGDIGILKAAIAGLNTSDRRKAALSRHIWRPRRFRALLDRFATAGVDKTRAKLLAAADPMAMAGPLVGMRSLAEIQARIAALREDADETPISSRELGVINDILALRGTSVGALSILHDLAVDMPAILGAVQRFSKRLDALSARGIDVETLPFEASYGRTTMEYYDGFVFGFYAADRPDLAPVATGGRYDALVRILGDGQSIPAIGGAIRPGLTLLLKSAINGAQS